MRRQFFRLFFSIVAITLVVLFIQILFLLLLNHSVTESWSEEVFDEFANSISASISNFKDTGSSDIVNLMVNKTNERISGVIIRDGNGDFALSLGVSPNGVPVPQLHSVQHNNEYKRISISSSRITANMEITPESVVYSIDKPKYEMAIIADQDLNGNPTSVESVLFYQMDNKGKVDVSYPAHLDRNDVAGTILISINGDPVAYLDVLVYNLDFYNPTKFVLYEYVRCFLLTLPVAVLISILLAAVISRRNGKVINDIKEALGDISKGKYGVVLPESNVEEYQEISSSIMQLDQDLERHSRSRKEWIRNISHDLNTPVTSMNLLIDGAIDGFFPLDDNLLKSLKTENDTLKQRIASVSYYSYLLSPTISFSLAEESLLDIVDEVLQIGRFDAKVEFSPELKISCDMSIAKRAIEEVVKNAVSYKSGGIPSIKAERIDSKVVITISNEGTLPDPLPLFFEPWARGDDSRTSGGSGLGLSIVYQAMELHSGTVAITEDNGEVSVTLEFPDLI